MRGLSSTSLALTLAAVAALSSAAGAQDAGPRVLATIKPVHTLVAQVMGATGTPVLLVDGSASPHTYALKPSDARAIGEADVFFRISDRMEPFTVKARRQLKKSAVFVSLAEAKGLSTLPVRAGGAFDGHADGHGHSHGGKSGKEVDGHVWLDTRNAAAMLDTIAETLAARHPPSAAVYRANAAEAKGKLDTLAAAIAGELAPVKTVPYVVFHDAYQYFEHQFGLTVAGSITVDPDVPPSGKRLADLRKKIAATSARCVFGEANFDTKVVNAVAEGTGARLGTLDPEGASLEAGPGLYEALMRKLAAAMKGCLAG